MRKLKGLNHGATKVHKRALYSHNPVYRFTLKASLANPTGTYASADCSPPIPKPLWWFVIVPSIFGGFNLERRAIDIWIL
jgi:hypothetical protein